MHHGWEFVVDALVRLAGSLAWPATALALSLLFRGELKAILRSAQSMFDRVSRVQARGMTIEVHKGDPAWEKVEPDSMPRTTPTTG